MAKSSNGLAAAIDLGSNSFHMIVAKIDNGQLIVLDRIREMIRLADGIDRVGRLNATIQQRALECLQRFGQRVQGLPHGSVRAVGTNTLRNAVNREEFLARAEKALGHPIDLIAGVEEARLIYLGVAQSLAVGNHRRLVMDIGGSSTELIIGDGLNPITLESLDMGCVSMTRNFFPDGVITGKRIEKARIYIQTELAPHITRFNRLGWSQAIGASGTIRAAHKIITAAGWSNSNISLVGLKKLLDVLADAKHINNIRLAGLSVERTPVFLGGAIILHTTIEALGIKTMDVSDRALREGLLHDLLGRIQHHDVRGQSVANLARRYHADPEHAARVAATAERLLSQAASSWDLDIDEHGQWLNWAAQLHEIGLDIAHSRHHHHAAYIIKYSDMAGFSQQEQAMLAALVRSHRRKLPQKLFRELPKRIGKPVRQLAALLRLSVILHRSRSASPLPHIEIKVQGKDILVRFPPQWLDQHPLTCADLDQEKTYLSSIGYVLNFS